jgi:hypothetical protein
VRAPFFGRRNELLDATAPGDPAHYEQTDHQVFLWKTPLPGVPAP